MRFRKSIFQFNTETLEIRGVGFFARPWCRYCRLFRLKLAFSRVDLNLMLKTEEFRRKINRKAYLPKVTILSQF